MVTRYQKRISGPMMDRSDMHMHVPRVENKKLRDIQPGENSATVRGRVEAARERHRVRFEGIGIASHADMQRVYIGNFPGGMISAMCS